jgi:cytochrome c2
MLDLHWLKVRSMAGVVLALCLTIGCAPHSVAQPKKAQSQQKSKVTAPISAKAREGQRIYNQLNCAQCHSVSNVGGCLAPQLDGVTKRLSTEYLRVRLGKDKEQDFVKLVGHDELFPHPRFADTTVASLIAYLQTLPEAKKPLAIASHHAGGQAIHEKPFLRKDFKPLPISADSSEGRRLFLDSGCMACHAINEAGVSLAPRLDGIGARHSRAYIEAHISNPQSHLVQLRKSVRGKSKMPQFDFAPNEVKQIAEFLLTLPAK